MVQFTPVGGCKSCHGSVDNPAPPQDLAGNTATTFKTVGAHQAHIKNTVLSTALTCTDCHPVVGSVDALVISMELLKSSLGLGPSLTTPNQPGTMAMQAALIPTVMEPPLRAAKPPLPNGHWWISPKLHAIPVMEWAQNPAFWCKASCWL